jgi:DNA-binding transcriptional ArsR family regulator
MTTAILDETDQISHTFAALADPTRRAILERLAAGEATVNELAEPFPVSVQAVSKHLKVLERAGLVTRGHRAQWRPCRLRAEPLAEANSWLEKYREFWEERFDRLEAYLEDIQRGGPDATATDGEGGDHGRSA